MVLVILECVLLNTSTSILVSLKSLYILVVGSDVLTGIVISLSLATVRQDITYLHDEGFTIVTRRFPPLSPLTVPVKSLALPPSLSQASDLTLPPDPPYSTVLLVLQVLPVHERTLGTARNNTPLFTRIYHVLPNALRQLTVLRIAWTLVVPARLTLILKALLTLLSTSTKLNDAKFRLLTKCDLLRILVGRILIQP